MPLNFYATFTNGTNNGVTGLVPLISVTRIALSSGTQSALFTAATMSAVTNCSGGYFYNMTASADLTAFDYFASITTNSTVSADTTYAASLWSEFGVQASVSIDNATSTRNSNLVSINGSASAAAALSRVQFTTSGTNQFLQTDVQMFLSQNNQGVSGINSIGQYFFSNSSTMPRVDSIVDPTSIDTALSGTHGNGSWEGASATDGALAFWNFLYTNATLSNSMGKVILDDLAALVGFSFNGAYTRSFHVQDNASNSLQSAHVRIGFNNQAELHTTPVSGNFTTALDAHTYAIDATCDGFSGYSGSLTVSGVGSTTLVLTAASVSPPALPGVCRVYFYLYNSAGSPMSGSTVTWQINTPPYNTGQQPPASVAAGDGLVYADVPKGITLQPTTPLGLQKEFTVPSDAGSTLEYAP